MWENAHSQKQRDAVTKSVGTSAPAYTNARINSWVYSRLRLHHHPAIVNTNSFVFEAAAAALASATSTGSAVATAHIVCLMERPLVRERCASAWCCAAKFECLALIFYTFALNFFCAWIQILRSAHLECIYSCSETSIKICCHCTWAVLKSFIFSTSPFPFPSLFIYMIGTLRIFYKK